MAGAGVLALMECPTCRAGGLSGHGADNTGLECDACEETFPTRAGVACFLRQFDDYTENYDQISEDDLREPKTPTAVKRRLAELIHWRADGVTCDLGCGDGYVITRIDSPDKVAVDIAFRYLARLPSSIARIWGRVEDVPLKSGSADTVIVTDVLEHVLDAHALAREIDRLLSPDGRVLLASPFEQDLSVYDLPEYKRKFGKYKYVHLRSVNDGLIEELFPGYKVCFSHLITDGMEFMEFKPYPIKFYDLQRGKR